MTCTEYISLAEAAKRVPGRPHASSLFRWARYGIRGVKLATIRSGNRLYTTQGALDDFLTELNESDDERLSREGC